MNGRPITLALLAAGLLGFAAWRWQLVNVEPAGVLPRPLELVPDARRANAVFEATLPAVPVGEQRLRAVGGVTLVHYWAPWERHSGAQVLALDSLRRTLPPGELTVAVVCFDPFPSVTRYATRLRLRLPVLLDVRRDLVSQLPCPRIPYTYVIDARGRVAVAQSGEVDWLGSGTRETLARVVAEPPDLPAREHS